MLELNQRPCTCYASTLLTETFPLLLFSSAFLLFNPIQHGKMNSSKRWKSTSFSEVLINPAIWLQLFPTLLPRTSVKVFFAVLNTRITSSITRPHGVLPFPLKSPIFAMPDSDSSYVSQQSSSSHGYWPQYCWCPVHSVSPGHLNGTALLGFNNFYCSETQAQLHRELPLDSLNNGCCVVIGILPTGSVWLMFI